MNIYLILINKIITNYLFLFSGKATKQGPAYDVRGTDQFSYDIVFIYYLLKFKHFFNYNFKATVMENRNGS